VLDAAPEVIAALPGMTPERLRAFLGERVGLARSAEPSALISLGPARAAATMEGSSATRVTVRISLDNGRRLVSEAVILVDGAGEEPFRVLSWRNDMGAPPAQAEARLR
jgi:general secretion pathway protein K